MYLPGEEEEMTVHEKKRLGSIDVKVSRHTKLDTSGRSNHSKSEIGALPKLGKVTS